MKRNLKVFSLVVLLAFLVLPILASADAVSYTESNGKYISQGNLSVGSYGTIKSGDAEYVYTDKGNGIKEWKFYLTAGSNFNYVYLSLVPSGLEILDIKSESGLTLLSDEQVSNSNVHSVLLMAGTEAGVQKGEKVLLFTVETKDTSTSGCVLNISPKKLACATVGSAMYFDKDGKSVTEDDYNKVCSNVGTTDEPLEDVPNNSETGIPVPYIALGGGLIALAGVYFLNKKNTKMFKL